MGFGEQDVDIKLFGRERKKVIMNWWKRQNAEFHNLLPSLTRIIYMCVLVYVYECGFNARIAIYGHTRLFCLESVIFLQ